ncbi:MAG: glycine cleavage system aminomethyltransferase GcvT [Bacteroidetes bacterium]|nr:glycine cleavage system aminomethyltransferase GcvT [Bacteroidota bacterium]
MDAKKITLSDFHESIGGKMVPFAGFYMPVRYSSDNEEHRCVREGVGVFDVSHMGEFHLKGEKALDLIQHVISNDASVLFDGKIQYAYLPNTEGGVVDDLLVYKIRDNEYMLVVNAGNIEKDWNWINSHNTFGVEMTNLSDDTSLFAVQGPKAAATLQKLTGIDLASMDYYTFVTGEFAGHQNITISATGYTGAGGFEIYLPNAIAEEVWKKIFEAGAEFDIKPIGLGARDTLRLEMGYCLYGNDITDITSPLEAGLGWVTKFTKKFINSENLLAEKTAGLKRKLVGLEMIDRGIPRSHYEICDAEGNVIGEITSGTQSPTLGKGIAMGFVKTEFSKTGTEIFVKIREKLLKAQVVKMPFVKPGV